MKKLSIVIPAYNEENRLPATLDKIERYIQQKDYDTEIIVVVEKSTDKTRELVQEYETRYSNIRHLENDERMGKGYTVRKGVLAAAGDIIMFTDSDLSTPIEELDKMLPLLELDETDCCIGDRQQIKRQPIHRIVLGAAFGYTVRLITGLKFRDTQCGFKAFKAQFARDVFNYVTTQGFSFDVEMLVIGQAMDYKISSVKVNWFDDRDSRVNVAKELFRTFRELMEIRAKRRAFIREYKKVQENAYLHQ